MRIKAYTVQIESGAICEAFTIHTSNQGRAILQAWNRFEKLVSAEPTKEAKS